MRAGEGEDGLGRRTILGSLEGVIEGLGNIGEVRPEGEFGDDVGEIHHYRQRHVSRGISYV